LVSKRKGGGRRITEGVRRKEERYGKEKRYGVGGRREERTLITSFGQPGAYDIPTFSISSRI
jgi:hypothetical protein